MNIDRTSLTLGWLVGKQMAAMRSNVGKTPVAYLYNGLRLPKLPEWDKETYPYAYIYSTTSWSSTTVKLCCYQELFTAILPEWSGGWELLAGGNTKLESKITYKTEDGLSDEEWSELSATSLNINLGSVEVNGELKPYRARVCTYPSDMIEWSNHSFYVENGEEWIVAADPVPVYE